MSASACSAIRPHAMARRNERPRRKCRKKIEAAAPRMCAMIAFADRIACRNGLAAALGVERSFSRRAGDGQITREFAMHDLSRRNAVRVALLAAAWPFAVALPSVAAEP